jgi:hypothetical protein
MLNNSKTKKKQHLLLINENIRIYLFVTNFMKYSKL